MEVSQCTDHFLPLASAVKHANDVEHATELLHVVRNELALPRVKSFDESRAHKTLRAIQALAHGSCGDLPGATARDVRDALVLDSEQAPSLASLVALLSPAYSGSTRKAAATVIHAMATPDVDVYDRATRGCFTCTSTLESVEPDHKCVSRNTHPLSSRETVEER